MSEVPPSGITRPAPDALVTDVDEPPPGKVMELAAACVRFVLAKYKVELDFTRDTLPMVDHYVDEARSSVSEHPETLPLTAHAIGAYLGEVVRRNHACWWRIDHDDPGAWRLEFREVLLTFYPVQVAYAALERADEELFSGFELPPEDRESLCERLAQLPAVSEQEYYAPSTHLDVLDIAVDALLARRAREPAMVRAYEPADYA